MNATPEIRGAAVVFRIDEHHRLALADAGAPLRRALINRTDFVIAEKLGGQE